MMKCHNIGVFEGHKHPQQPPKISPLARGDIAHPFDALARSARPHVGRYGAISAGGGYGRLWLCWLMLAIGGVCQINLLRNSKNCLRKYFFYGRKCQKSGIEVVYCSVSRHPTVLSPLSRFQCDNLNFLTFS